MGIYKRLFKLVIITCLGIYAVTGYTLALSEAEIKSNLNQLLDVRIELLTNNTAELDDLKVILSQSAENNVSRYPLKYEVLESGAGNIIKITSNEVIREPIIEFTLDISWTNGHVVRKYSFLIDPPRN